MMKQTKIFLQEYKLYSLLKKLHIFKIIYDNFVTI